MSANEAQAYINTTRVHMAMLLEDGFVRPFVAIGAKSVAEHAFARSDLDVFLSRLSAGAPDADPGDRGLHDIRVAAKKARCPAMDVVHLVLDRRLATVRRNPDVRGYMGMLVDPVDVRAALGKESRDGLSVKEVRVQTGWSQNVAVALLTNGLLKCRLAPNAITRIPERIVDQSDLDDFTGRYVQLRQVAEERKVHHAHLKVALAEVGIHPVFDRAMAGTPFYVREALPP